MTQRHGIDLSCSIPSTWDDDDGYRPAPRAARPIEDVLYTRQVAAPPVDPKRGGGDTSRKVDADHENAIRELMQADCGKWWNVETLREALSGPHLRGEDPTGPSRGVIRTVLTRLEARGVILRQPVYQSRSKLKRYSARWEFRARRPRLPAPAAPLGGA